ncbi:MAG: hypothetical protein A2X17_02765 [Bacteroidetes bacterium GWF2_41_61]|nr:MAG: hypothetical protein A2X17_02765 [Bacteroidetes bacterium GWF2_41_61]OFY91423.1 MAG: hypothetical protein A2266_04640 [Bacteroidetes bacterium RIFOXYA12_FULL_40_10]
MEFTITQRRLLYLVRGALNGVVEGGEGDLFSSMSHSEWHRLLEAAAKQGVTAVAADGMCKGVLELLPKDIAVRWFLGVDNIKKRYQRQMVVLGELRALFAKSQIEVLVLKGAVLAALYPISEHRECGDIDIFLYENYEKGNLVVDRMGITVDKKGFKHSKFFFKGIDIENHKSLLNVANNRYDREIERHLRRMLEDGKIEDFHLLFNIRHTIVHFLSSGVVLRHFTDLYLLLKHFCSNTGCEAGLREIFEILKQQGQLKLFTGFVNLINECFGETGVEKHLQSFYKECSIEPVGEDVARKIYGDTFVKIANRRDISELLQMGVLQRKVVGAKNMMELKWKYDLIERGYFAREFLKRIGYAFKLYNPKVSL